MFEVNVNGRKQRYNSKPTMNADISGSSTSIPKPLTYDYMPEGYPKKDGWVIEWDGNTEGKVAVTVGSKQLYKISDMVLSVDDLLSATITFPDHPGETFTITSDHIHAESDDIIVTSTPIKVVIVRKDNVDAEGVTIQEKGVYVFPNNKKFKMTKQNITPMSTDFLPKNLNVVFRGELGHAPTSCNVTYNELRDWVERDIPVFAVFITANAKFNIIATSSLTDSLGFIYFINGSTSRIFTYKSDGTFGIQPNQS